LRCAPNLRSIEGLACAAMGGWCFAFCKRLESLRGWPRAMDHVPAGAFRGCEGLASVGCDLSGVIYVGANAFWGCTSLLPPALAAHNADPTAVLAFLRRKARRERAPLRYAIYASVRRARRQEGLPRTAASPAPLAFAIARLPPDMAREVVEFKLGAVARW
jgi:hypothetical protein